MAQQTDHIGDTNKMVEHHIVDTNKMITMAQQTAVEWLIEQLEKQVYRIDHKDNRIIPISFDDIIEIQKQAKAMEKEQIIKAASTVLWNNSSSSIEQAEKYYNETFGGL